MTVMLLTMCSEVKGQGQMGKNTYVLPKKWELIILLDEFGRLIYPRVTVGMNHVHVHYSWH